MDLEGAVDKMRGQQSELQRRLKEEMDRKTKLEVRKLIFQLALKWSMWSVVTWLNACDSVFAARHGKGAETHQGVGTQK